MSGTVVVEGAELHYSVSGNGPTCFFLTGIGSRPYARLTPRELAGVVRLVYVELRGSGDSGGDPSELTFDRVAADLEAIRRELGLDRVAVLGHSLLGALAIEYGRRFPAHVSHIVAVGTPPVGDMRRVSAAATEFFERDATEERKRILRENMERLPSPPSLRDALFAQAPLQFFDTRFDPAPCFEGARARPEFFARLMGPLTAEWTVDSDATPLVVPLLVAHGRYDYVVPHGLWDTVAPVLPAATVEMFEASAHYPFFEEPERFACVLADWMA